MNYKLCTGPELNEQLKGKIPNSKKTRLAVAFWGKGATERLDISKGAKIVCNLTSGGTNPQEIRALIQSGAEVRQHNALHAKIGWVDDHFSFVGSSNMSANGLGDEADVAAGWEESNVVYEGVDPSVKKRFKALWKASEKISNECLSSAEKAWRQRQKANQVTRSSKHRTENLIEALKNAPEHFAEYNAHVVIYNTLTVDEEPIVDSANELATEMYGSAFEVYWDWKELPADAILVDFRIPNRGLVAFEGIYKRDPNFSDLEENDENFQVAYVLDDLAGYAVGKKEKRLLRNAVSAYINANDADKDGAFCFPISGLSRYMGDA